MGHAVGLLTTQPAEVQDPGEPQDSGTSGSTWEEQKGTHVANVWPHLKLRRKVIIACFSFYVWLSFSLSNIRSNAVGNSIIILHCIFS